MKALVTGGSKGIGAACAAALKCQGHEVLIASRTKGIFLEATDQNQISNAESMAQGVDILINNVGGGGTWGNEKYIEYTSPTVWAEVLQKNLVLAERLTMAAIPHMRRQGWGRVVTISSIHGKEGVGRPWFTVAKAAQIALMKSLARTSYLARSGITFNTVCPGYIETKILPELMSETIPAGRFGTADEVAAVVAFLCTKEAAYVNGACVAVDGGESHSY